MKLIDLTGKKFGKLTVIKRAGSDKESKPMWECLCDCGNTPIVRGYCLKRKVKPTRSCGCLISEVASKTMRERVIHGQSRRGYHTKLYRRWVTIKQRCYDKTHKGYANYGGRGIGVCDKWLNDFRQFAKDVGEIPNQYATVERIDTNKGYAPGNVKWATRKQQANNRRDNITLTFKGKTQTVTQWAEDIGVLPVTLFGRKRMGWSDKEILTTPIKGKR